MKDLVAYQTDTTFETCKKLTKPELNVLAAKLEKVKELRAAEVNLLCQKLDLGPSGNKGDKIKAILLRYFKGPF